MIISYATARQTVVPAATNVNKGIPVTTTSITEETA
jgi:hypothetical protein